MLVGVPALERLQSLNALRKRRAGMKWRKPTASAVSEPLGERFGVWGGGHLDTPRLLFGQVPPEVGLDLRVQGVFQRSTQLGESVSH
jgi:hypothetical protein